MDKDNRQLPSVDYDRFFREIKTIAVVGYSDKPERAGHYVAHYMKDHGYEVIGVNPKLAPESGGVKVYASLAEIPAGTKVDVVDVFRSPPAVPAIVEESAALDPLPAYFFMQPGAENSDAAKLAQEKGMQPIMHACLMAAHKIWK